MLNVESLEELGDESRQMLVNQIQEQLVNKIQYQMQIKSIQNSQNGAISPDLHHFKSSEFGSKPSLPKKKVKRVSKKQLQK